MNRHLNLIMLLITTSLVGCDGRIGNYVAASSISTNGFARNDNGLRNADGQTIQIWGFVDHRNMYGNDGAKKILEEWWSGDGSSTSWSFNLKGEEHDEPGHSFAVHVPNDQGRDGLLRVFLKDARERRPTKVFLKGKIFTFDAPMNFGVGTGLNMELQSSRDVLLEPP